MQREGYLHHHCVEKKSHKIASRFESARLSLNGIVILGVPFNVANVNTVNIRNVHLWTFEYIHMLCLLLFLRSQSFTVETGSRRQRSWLCRDMFYLWSLGLWIRGQPPSPKLGRI